MESYLIPSHQPTGFPSPPEVMESDAERVAFEPPSLEVTTGSMSGWAGPPPVFHEGLGSVRDPLGPENCINRGHERNKPIVLHLP